MKPFVWDTTGPLHASRCDRTSVLLEAAGSREHCVTPAVAEELARLEHPVDPQYFSVVDLATIEELVSLVIWQSRLGSKSDLGHHLGEAEVATVAEIHVMTAIIDDRKARDVARRYGLDAHGVLWAISRAPVEGRVASPSAFSGLCDQMLSTGIRWSIGPGGYPRWFEEHREELT